MPAKPVRLDKISVLLLYLVMFASLRHDSTMLLTFEKIALSPLLLLMKKS